MTDNLTKTQRSYCMSRCKGKDTGLERVVRSALHKRGYRFRKHVKGLPGQPDIVFVKAKAVVFLDGDFWHGFRFPVWEQDLPKFWQKKIGETRKRDMRIWEHSIEKDLDGVVGKICALVESYV